MVDVVLRLRESTKNPTVIHADVDLEDGDMLLGRCYMDCKFCIHIY
jgi:hypothetical protein